MVGDRASTVQQPRKLRVLCLHGFRQTAGGFFGRTRAFRKALKSEADFEFIDAPVVLHTRAREGSAARAETDPESPPRAAGRCWWQEVCMPDGVIDYAGWRDAVSFVLRYIRLCGPFHGICGFSQGGLLAALVCAQVESGEAGIAPLQFVLIFSAYSPLPRDAAIAPSSLQTPSLHVWGLSDKQVSTDARVECPRAAAAGPDKTSFARTSHDALALSCARDEASHLPQVEAARSEALSRAFCSPQVHVHGGGHYIPTSPAARDMYRDFVCASAPPVHDTGHVTPR